MDETESYLLPQVHALVGRERQIALLVYERGRCTAKEIEASIVPAIKNAAIRSMLMRLVRKGVLSRHFGQRARSAEYVYVPAITPLHVRRSALQQIAILYFGGSLQDLISEAKALLESSASPCPPTGASGIVRSGSAGHERASSP